MAVTGLVLITGGPVATAAERVALVIGNSAYKHTPRLENPANDARDVARSLETLGFEVIQLHDLDKASMDRAIRRFADALASARTGLFYYAGHGLQVGGQNYLVPIDAELTTASALDFEMVRLDLVHRTMESAVKTNIIVLDACRDNPLSRNLARALGTRSASIGRGLAAVESGEGTLISFSTQPGAVALDGEGRNSPYAAALVKHMGRRGDDISTVLINVRNDVMETTARRQVPWEHSALTARFYFVPPDPGAGEGAVASAPGPTYEQQAEMAFWSAVKDSGNRLVIQTYLDRFPQGTFVGLARALIDEIERKETLRAAALKEAERARAERARKAAEALSEAALKADPGKQAEALRRTKEEAVKAAEQSVATAEQAAQEARRELERAKAEQTAIDASGGGTVRHAALETPRQDAAGQPAIQSAEQDPRSLATRLQVELVRVGCDPGKIDGNWGRKGRSALGDFARHAKLALPVDEPSEAAIEAVAARRERVCPLPCDDDEVERDGACVAKAARTRSASKSRDDQDETVKPTKRTSRSKSSSTSSGSSGRSSGAQKSSSKSGSGSTSLLGGLLVGTKLGIRFGKTSSGSPGHSTGR